MTGAAPGHEASLTGTVIRTFGRQLRLQSAARMLKTRAASPNNPALNRVGVFASRAMA